MKIKNWKEFQHYKDRDPKWIKLYTKLLNDDEWFDLDPKHAKVLVMLWCLASEDPALEGNLPSIKKMSFRLRIPQSSLESTLSNLSHWVEQDASELLAGCYQDASLETEERREREEERPRRASMTDDEWIESLRKNEAYSHVNFAVEFGKMDAWFSSPKGKGRKKTRNFILNWINKIEKPVAATPTPERKLVL